MKRYHIFFVFLVSGLLFASCEKQLDIDPTQSINADDALKTSSLVEAALVGAFSNLGDANVYGGTLFVQQELLADTGIIDWYGTFQGLTQILNKSIPVNNDFVTDSWTDMYRVINDVNNVLTAVDTVSEAKRNNVEGAAKFIRGSMYFDLVRAFARAYNDGNPATNPGVPIVLTPTRLPVDSTYQVMRASVEAVYQQAITDLTEAENLMDGETPYFVNNEAAAAMLARVYLQKGDYTNAAAAADRAITLGGQNGRSLTPTYVEAFPYIESNVNANVPNTEEDIFAIQVNNTDGTNSFNTYFSLFGRGDVELFEEFFDIFETGDEREFAFYTSGGSNFVGKFDMVYGNVHIIRLAEMYLIRAEANFRLGTQVGATPAADLNRIRNRAGLPSISPGDLTLEDIIHDRQVELVYEGHALHDFKRLQRNIGNIPWNSPKLIFPIPARELVVNKKLTQNEGY